MYHLDTAMRGKREYFQGKAEEDLTERYKYMRDNEQLPSDYHRKAIERVLSWDHIPPLVTLVELAALLRVQPSTVRDWRKKGLDEYGHPKMGPMWTRVTSGRVMYRREDIDAFFLRSQHEQVEGINKTLAKKAQTGVSNKKKPPKREKIRETLPAHLAFRK